MPQGKPIGIDTSEIRIIWDIDSLTQKVSNNYGVLLSTGDTKINKRRHHPFFMELTVEQIGK